MNCPRNSNAVRYSRYPDVILVAALGLIAFLLGCYQLFDTDVWWQLRSGQWILENRRLPQLDIFTFSSSDRAWINLHWGFQVVLALAYALGGTPGMIVLAAAACCAAFLISFLARERDWSLWVAALCWLPALVLMSTRFDPRPEVFSLVYLACFLAILLRVERRPALAWVLAPIQVLWVNSHGLFVLGPIVLGFYLVDRGLFAWNDSRRSATGPECQPRRFWRHLAPASAAVALACVASPYGLRGALFPLELFPKISDPTNPYKSYIAEFASLRSATLNRMRTMPGTHFHLRTQVFLLLLIPWSFVLPAAWREWHSSQERGGRVGAGISSRWIVGWVLVCAFALVAALGMPSGQTSAWLVRMGRVQPATLLVIGECGAGLLALRSRRASMIVAIGTAATAAWGAWLRVYLFELWSELPGGFVTTLPYLAAILGVLTAALVVRAGGSPFRLLLAAAFTYLSFQAVRNVNLFGLVAGAVLAWNMSEWLAAMAAGRPPDRLRRILVRPVHGMITAIVVLWGCAVVTDRYYSFAGDNIHFGLHERPLTFAHEAARFAGRPGMPARALVFGLEQTGVYVYHNGPDRKLFMDARLEVPSLGTFQTYVRIERWLHENDSRWYAAVSRLGDPLVLIGHEDASEAEATLLSHPRWRCLYFDAIASVFVPRHGVSSAPSYPEFDFAGLHFAGRGAESTPLDRQQALTEATAILRLATVLRKRGGNPWRLRIPVLIRGSDLIRELLTGRVADPSAWRLLGLIEWEMIPDLTRRPPGPDDPWDPATSLPWVRATYCFCRALEAAPDDLATRSALAECFRMRRMAQARHQLESHPAQKVLTIDRVDLLDEGPEPRAGSRWSRANRMAVTYLHWGDPDSARRVCTEVNDPPSQALRLTRMAEADLADLNATAAIARCRMALELDSTLGEAWYVLAVALLDSGRAGEAMAAGRESLKHQLTASQRDALIGAEEMVNRSRR